MNKKIIVLTITLIIIIVLSYSNELTTVHAEEAPELPDYTDFVKENPSNNIGPGAPAIVFPGDTLTIELKYNVTSIDYGYIYMVALNNDKLTLYNYSISIMIIDEHTLNITIPANVEPGLYDLVLIGETTYRIERSIWVIRSVSELIKIAHITDLHFGTGYPDIFAGDRKRIAGLLLVNMLKPDIVINTGDETDTSSESQYISSRALRYMLLYEYPVFLNPGNHDWPNSNFIKYYGPTIWYRLISDKILIIGVNTDGEKGYLDWSQLLFIEEILEKYHDIPIKIIQMHHPIFYWQGELYLYYNHTIFYTNPRENPDNPLSYYWGANLTATRYFLKICEDYNVSIVFAGHIHRDQYVIYHSMRTNTTTYFITTTTLAHSTGTYNGFQYIVLNTTNLNMTFPYAPPTFIGFKNYSKDSVWNSIFNMPSYWSGNFWFTKHAYTFDLENTILNISNTIILALPWNGEFKGVHVDSENGASIIVKDYLLVNGFLYIALEINMPVNSRLVFVIYNMEDNIPPHIEYEISLPDPPRLGIINKLYFEAFDEEWGLKEIEAYIVYDDQEFPVNIRMVNPTTYIVELPRYSGSEPKTIILKINASDYAENTIAIWYRITLYPKDISPTETPIETISISPTTTITSIPEETTTTEIETTMETPLENITTTETIETSTTPLETITKTPETSTPFTPREAVGEVDYTSVYILLIIVLVLIIIAVTIMKKK